MLPSELLLSRRQGDRLEPRYLKPHQRPWAQRVLEVIRAHHRKPRGELTAALRGLEGDSPDYRIVRGLAHLALADQEFTLAAPDLDPEALRQAIFVEAARAGFGEAQNRRALAEVAGRLQLDPTAIRTLLYADLPENHLLATLPEDNPEALVDRYNLAQAQGILYSALHLRLSAHRNVPGEYRRLFQQLKFFGLMYAVEGHLEDGYQIYVDGPASLFRQTRKYGLKMAAFLPSLLHITRWQLEATLEYQGRELCFVLDSDTKLRSHRPRPAVYDSLLEQRFVERFVKLDTPWTLEREVAIVDLKGTVFVPDFALRHGDGRIVYVEIVGFWHPDYLRRKFAKVRRAAMDRLVLAVSDRLNVGAEALEGIPGPVLFFKGKLEPKRVLAIAESMGQAN